MRHKVNVGLPVGGARGWMVWNDSHNPMVCGTNIWIYVMLVGESLHIGPPESVPMN